MTTFLEILRALDAFYWGYIGFSAILIVGFYLTFKSGFYQFRVLFSPIKTLKAIQARTSDDKRGISPFRLYFASVGGMVGLGNIVGVVSAVMIGGPGALIWLWLAAFCGMIIKYSEIFLGMKYRETNKFGDYDGGPMVYLKHAFKYKICKKVLPVLFCIFMLFYSVEIFQFVVIVDTISTTWAFDRYLVIAGYLCLCLYGGLGGIGRLAIINTILMPIFITGYLGIGTYLIADFVIHQPYEFLSLFKDIFSSAFTGHAATGGFVGSSMLMAMQQGTSRAVYSGDLGIGYDAIIQSESKAKLPEVQASLSIFGVLTDMTICTFSIIIVLISGVWKGDVQAFQAVGVALSEHLFGAPYFMAALLIVAGYSTVIAYLAVGNKIMQRLFGRMGFWVYAIYSAIAFVCFSFLDQYNVLLLMSLSGGMLMLTNLSGLWSLRHQITFHGIIPTRIESKKFA